ncbi:amidoligase family protein [Citreimonas salinaria]|uniref:Putative amidoligase enzyme n=1 Tax=Citreimonas salinaria TaxID=321339 RepID=A0A1H3FAN2_9RHOB|nr:amidoligase family protein [Citreimonas salinaria]SDX87418.1 Putative amidoligase enzyme [Citreimonas salinaria]
MSRPDDPFPPLPGAERLCGVEIELAGLTEIEVAEIACHRLGGGFERSAPHVVVLHDSALGDLRVELDTALRKLGGGRLVQQGLDALRGLIPVEIVTDPLTPRALATLDALREDLRRAGALGSRHGALLGFGVHLNPARSGDDMRVVRVARAFGLAEDWLRTRRRIDITRRILPFVDPWPAPLTDDLVDAPPDTLAGLARLYARHTQSRNHGLDLLPLLRDAVPDAYEQAFPRARTIGGRPAYHFRLPDCRIDEPGWSLAEPWADWLAIERVADDSAMTDALCAAWREHRTTRESRDDWARQVGNILGTGVAA